MANDREHESDGDDSAPESVSFGAAKQENVEQAHKINEQIKQIRESQKLKRKERQDKYIEQKKKKLGSFKLSKEMLNKLDDKEVENEAATVLAAAVRSKSDKSTPKNTKKTFKDDSENEDDLTTNSLSEFIPLKTFKNYGISVVSLKSIDKKPLIASDQAKHFKNTMLNRPGIRRQSAQKRISYEAKRKYVKSK